ncbi:LolA-like outer membrane lipoprotein chaperone [Sulfurimonas sp.]|uniref:LolA-like outer membrane lipoprotein chaperone n=1 Tax=Sulfurimonas sp. TaxID=2022749 RepID=UPI002B460BF2|nr:LolA-like outer membrane lipoprotein chaperone [Sulfurimonas sp.]
MKYILTLLLSSTLSFASIDTLKSFKANFTQTITDEKNKSLVYRGQIIASKPQNALWNYKKPIKKNVYINSFRVVVVEPEIEQVIIRNIKSDFDFFKILKSAKQINKNTYEAKYRESKFTIIIEKEIIKSISYIDEFENNVKIIFSNQEQNKKINNEIFIPKYPLEFDVIRD